MMRTLLAGIISLFSMVTWSQNVTLQGKCTDSKGNPVELVKVVCMEANEKLVYTDESGIYRLEFPAAQKKEIKVLYTPPGSDTTFQRLYMLDGKNMVVPDVRFRYQNLGEVVIQETKIEPFGPAKLQPIKLQTLPRNSVETYIVYTTAAVSNNELTSNYNVRGGAYNENLVYVNDFLIYRPFLTRAGQQEGMSFIHTSLVKDISFSAGGFGNEYGDRMSSVLDIKYKEPDSLHASAMASLLGVESHVEYAPSSTFSFLAGARYRSNGYLLNSLPTKGAYNPVFWDAQIMTTKWITENLSWQVIGHLSTNNYRFSPQTQETDFGTANEAYSFTIYFEGQEQTRFQTMMAGTSLNWHSDDRKTKLDFFGTIFNSNEKEYFDILGQYYINELETDPSKEEFGDSIAVLGIGSFLNHARNRLDARIINIYHNGSQELVKGIDPKDSARFREHTFHWGVNFQMDDFHDVLSEWRLIDSAGYSLPQEPADKIILFETIKGEFDLQAQRYTSFVQLNSSWSRLKRNHIVTVKRKYKISRGNRAVRTFTDTIVESAGRWTLSLGSRMGYTSSNDEFYVTPRFTVKYFPRAYMVQNNMVKRRSLVFRFSSGMYYQPPFYREFRTFDGALNMNVKAQKSLHAVLGADAYLNLWDRESPFKFSVEAYYKYLWDVNPYEIENVRTRYYADNNAVAYAYGLDLNLHGEFVSGIESFFKVGFLSTKEDILDDYYYEYYNAAGEKIIFGYSEDQTPVDTVLVEPGYVPRPTDQLVNFGALIQDRMPGFESFSVNMGMQFGSRLPYGPPDFQRYKDTLRMKSYFRVDIGFAYDFLYKEKEKQTFWNKHFEDAIISFEVFNLLGINNVLSKQWIQDVEGKYYAIPNYLTQRRFNLKLILKI